MTVPFNHTVYEFAVRNDSGEEIPAFAVMQMKAPVAVSGRLVWPVVKPGADSAGWPRFYLVNGPSVIPAGASGNGTRAKADNPAQVLRRKAPPLTHSEHWAPAHDKWYLDRVYMGGYIALGPEAVADGEAGDDDTAKALFHSEGPNEPFLVEIVGTFNGNAQPGEAQIMEQSPLYTVIEDDEEILLGGFYGGTGRNIKIHWPTAESNLNLVGQVWVQRNSQSGAYNVLINHQGYIPPVSAAKLRGAADDDPVALVSEL